MSLHDLADAGIFLVHHCHDNQAHWSHLSGGSSNFLFKIQVVLGELPMGAPSMHVTLGGCDGCFLATPFVKRQGLPIVL